jgi:hypothetical protein
MCRKNQFNPGFINLSLAKISSKKAGNIATIELRLQRILLQSVIVHQIRKNKVILLPFAR